MRIIVSDREEKRQEYELHSHTHTFPLNIGDLIPLTTREKKEEEILHLHVSFFLFFSYVKNVILTYLQSRPKRFCYFCPVFYFFFFFYIENKKKKGRRTQ